ncbi:hypothetical protein [Algoriphagus sp. Y33]|uniref:hypothetical protein n=1 Tax=Algoriphagus sp. Y33 TaxID=2772483 RepID=UPI00177BAF17|nr:hypothetical protein [Algoriphagus sp. Y33]
MSTRIKTFAVSNSFTISDFVDAAAQNYCSDEGLPAPAISAMPTAFTGILNQSFFPAIEMAGYSIGHAYGIFPLQSQRDDPSSCQRFQPLGNLMLTQSGKVPSGRTI